MKPENAMRRGANVVARCSFFPKMPLCHLGDSGRGVGEGFAGFSGAIGVFVLFVCF